MISIIVAVAHNNIIGVSNKLPWYVPADLRHFKAITIGHTVIMGRKTFDSIIAKLGKPLSQRTNIVITRDHTFHAEGVKIVHSLEDALRLTEDQEAFVIGGAEVYAQALPMAQKIYLTEIDADIPGDTYFPVLDRTQWREVHRETHSQEEKNPYNYTFIDLVRYTR